MQIATVQPAPATTGNSVTTPTVTLTELREGLLDAVTAMRVAVDIYADVDARLAAMLPALETRIERNRARSERARHGHSHNTNGNGNGGDRYGGVELKLTDHGLLLQCQRCGRPVA